MTKQCSGSLTNGEELKNGQLISVGLRSIVVLLCRDIKGAAGTIGSSSWIFTSDLGTKNSLWLSLLLFQDGMVC